MVQLKEGSVDERGTASPKTPKTPKSPATKKRAANGAKAGSVKRAKVTEEARQVEGEVIKVEDNAVDALHEA